MIFYEIEDDREETGHFETVIVSSSNSINRSDWSASSERALLFEYLGKQQKIQYDLLELE